MPQDRKKKQAKKFGSVKKRVPELINPETTPPGPSRAAEIVNETETSESASSIIEYREDCFSDLLDLELNTLERAFGVERDDHAESSEAASSVQIPRLRSVLEPGKKYKAWSNIDLPTIKDSSQYATSPTYSPIASPKVDSLDLERDVVRYDPKVVAENFDKLLAVGPEEWGGFTLMQVLEKTEKNKILSRKHENLLADLPQHLKGATLRQACEELKKENGKEPQTYTPGMSVPENGFYQTPIKQVSGRSGAKPENGMVSQRRPDEEGVDIHGWSHEDTSFAMELCIEMIHCRPALRNKKSPAVEGLYKKVLDAIKEVRAAGIPKQDQHDEIRRRLEKPFDKAAQIAAAGVSRAEKEIAQHLIETHGSQRMLDIIGEIQAEGIPEQERDEEVRKRLEKPDDRAALESEEQTAKSTPKEDLENWVSDNHNPTHGLSKADTAFAIETCGELILRRPELDRESVPLEELLLCEVIETIKKVRATAITKKKQNDEIMERLVEIFDQAAPLVEESLARYARGETAPPHGDSNPSPVPSGDVTQPQAGSPEGSDSSDETTIGDVFDTWWMMVKMEVKEKVVRLGVLHEMPKSMEVLEYRKAMNDVMASAPASSGIEGQGKPPNDTTGASSADQMSSADRPYLPNIWLDRKKPVIPKYPRKPFSRIVYKSNDVPMLRPIQRFTLVQINAIRAATAEVEKEKRLERENQTKKEEEAKKNEEAKKK